MFELIRIIKKNNGKLNRLNFLVECAEQIIEEYAIRQTQISIAGCPTASSTTKPTRLIEKHFPNFISAISSKANPLRRCVVCSKNKIRKQSRYWCFACEMLLCLVSCFEKYYTEKTN